ncbi:hypothetical protein AC58_0766 [Escherichia coli 3-105-05_S3_C3]|nr:hypothetical protein AC58_0766 [Escherichia coli 3-105-05_S3_C3]
MNHRQRRWFFCDQFQNKNNDPIKIKQRFNLCGFDHFY